MAKFKREPKEMTTETSVEPRMKKGMPPTIQKTGAMGMPRAARPNVAPPLMAAPAMKEGGKADMMQDKAMMKKAFKQHDAQEHKGGKGTTLKLKHGGMHTMKKATGGVANTQGGYKTGGSIKPSEYKTGGMIRPAKYKEGGHVEMKGDSCGHTVMKKKYGGSC